MSSSNVPVLKLENKAPNVTLHLRDLSGKTVYQYPPESAMVTCAARAVNVCRAMLNSPLVRHALMEFTTLYSIERPEARFRDSVLIAEQTDNFISSICEDFPRLFVDDSITISLVLGHHVKRPWDLNFKPSDQCIYLNGENFRSMCNAAIKSNHNPLSQANIQVTTDTQNYQNWWFLFANILFREIVHVFDTYLTKGQDSSTLRKAGSLLEELLFGGILSFSHNPTLKTCDKNVPFLIYKDSEYRILLATIEGTLKEEIDLPYATSDLSEDGRVLLPGDRIYRACLSILHRSQCRSNLHAQAAEEGKLATRAAKKELKQKTAYEHSKST